ncbi:hypothetical protein F5887DRAFT_302500 [Amanita rubescens]|nr:hypothetical protein F5887DRAFT_302500 [Amanita rubescens]
MHSFLCLYILSLAVSAFSTPLETETQVLTQRFNPDATEVHAHQARSPVHYPLRSPHRRSITHKTRLTSMAASNYTVRGYLQVLDESYSSLGFVSKEYNKYGEYGLLTNDSADYLSVSLDMDETSSKNGLMSTTVSPCTPALTIHPSCIILGQNGPFAAYPFFGAIVGFNSTSNDLGQGNYDYSVFGGTVQRSAGAAAIQGGNSFTHLTGKPKSIETAIFSHNQSSNEVSCYWVNRDGSRPETYMGFSGQEGDKTAFANKYGSNMIYWITLKLVPVH